MSDSDKPGISLRFIRQYKPEEKPFLSTMDKAILIAMADHRKITYAEKIADALTFLKLQTH